MVMVELVIVAITVIVMSGGLARILLLSLMRVLMASQIHLCSILSPLRVHSEETRALFVTEGTPLVPFELMRLNSMPLVHLVSLIWIISCQCQILSLIHI